MKKLIYIVAIALASCTQRSYNDETTKCVVTQVEFYPIGSINTVQVDPLWKAKTDCNFDFSSRNPIRVGDTITIIKRKFN